MTTFTARGNARLNQWDPDGLREGKVEAQSSTQFALAAPNDVQYSISGTGFSGFHRKGLPAHGTVKSITMSHGANSFTISGMKMAVTELAKFVADKDFTGLQKAIFSGNDTFNLTNAAQTIAHGFAGDDTFNFAGNLTAADHINGGAGHDVLHLAGDYSAGLKFDSLTIHNIEEISLGAGHSYNLTLNNGNIAKGQALTVNASALGAGNKLTLNDGAESNGKLFVTGGKGNDVITTGGGINTVKAGAGNDHLIAGGGTDHMFGGAGNDTFDFGAHFDSGDSVDGGAGDDTLVLTGNYTGLSSLVLQQSNVANVEHVQLGSGNSYALTLGNLGTASLNVNGADLKAGDVLNVNGSGVTATALDLVGGAGSDVLTGGSQADTIVGGLGADVMNGGGGADNFVYQTAADSTGSAIDTINNFDGSSDTITLPNGVTSVAGSPVTGLLSNLSGLSGLIGSTLGAHGAELVQPLLGALSGDVFMVIDQNGQSGYQAGQDLVVQLVNATHLGDLGLANFV